MQSSMTLSTIVALFSAMIILAAIPSISVLTVSTKSATSGLIHGIFTTLGILVGDIIFIFIALRGLSFLMTIMGSLFSLVKYLGGAYLLLLGIGLCRSKLPDIETEMAVKSSLLSSFLTGLFITLADQKAILFYLGFFPAFLDLAQISDIDIILIIATTIVAVGGVKIGYAFMADRARLLLSHQTRKRINIMAGCVMIAVGVLLLVKS